MLIFNETGAFITIPKIMLSVVIPVYNEVQVLPVLLARLKSALENIGAYELIFVDDGSIDHTLQILTQHHQTDSRIKIIELSRNFGHQAAITAGLEHANGEFIAMMDSDLQDPPELLPEMLEILQQRRFDVVNGFRHHREEESFRRRFLTRLFHKIFSNISGLEEIENTGHFSMINREALNALLAMKEKTRYIPGLRHYIGFRQTQIEYSRQERFSGKSKMRFSALFRLALDAMFAFSRFPLKLCLWLGITGVFIFFLAGVHVLLSKFTGWAPVGWSSTMISLYFLGSIQLTFLGVLGEYIYRTYRESQNRPIYFIRKKYF